MIGMRYGKLVVVSKFDETKVICRCDCGSQLTLYSKKIRSGEIKSCGCGRTGRPKHPHGKVGSRVYRIWRQMKQRCNNPKAQDYKNYGGRGIRVCYEWETSFENFYADMGDPPDDTTLDRIDTNSDYSMENCKWATWKEQHNNRRDNHLLTAFGRTQSLTAWSEETQIPVSTLKNRMYRSTMKKMTLEEAIKSSSYAQQRGKL